MKQGIKLVLTNTVARRNPMAAALSAGQFHKRIVRSKKIYQRRGRNNKDQE